MNKNIELFLDYGIYNNTIYYPNTLKKTKQYLSFLRPLLIDLRKEKKTKLYKYITKKNINIYSLSICISILKLNKNTYSILKENIKNDKDIFIFLWIYTTLNGAYNNLYINKLLLEKPFLIADNIDQLYKVYMPPYSTRSIIYSKLKNKYKVKYLIESQEDLNKILPTIKSLDIKPLDIYVEMGFTFEYKIKNEIVDYFLDNEDDVITLIYYIDRWYIENIPSSILEKIKKIISKLSKNNIYKLLVLNSSLSHIELNNIIENFINTFDFSDNAITVNINYEPNMQQNMKWDGLHTYNAYISSIITILSLNFTTKVNIKDKRVDNSCIYDLYSNILTNSTFSLDKSMRIQKTETPTILFSNDIIDGYNILWDVINDNCPLYQTNEYLSIVGKSIYTLESVIKYINYMNEKSINNQKFDNKEDQIPNLENKEDNLILQKENEIDKELSSKNKFIDSIEETINITKNSINNVKYTIKKVK